MTKTTPVTQADLAPVEPVKIVTRFSLFQRIEHLLLLLSFSALGLTGLPQKYPDAGLSQFVLTLFGGIEAIRVVHRGAAIILMMVSIYHVVEVL